METVVQRYLNLKNRLDQVNQTNSAWIKCQLKSSPVFSSVIFVHQDSDNVSKNKIIIGKGLLFKVH